MLKNKTVAVVVPAYNEEEQIGIVIETMPGFVDRIVVVNDNSSDATVDVVLKYINSNYNQTQTKLKKTEIRKTFHNNSEIFLDELNKTESEFFPKSEVKNSRPDRDRIILISHFKNSGNGISRATGFKWCKDNNIDCIATMDGDGQMDPDELGAICLPIVLDGVDYVKGNRLIHGSAEYFIPKKRFIGNSMLSILTKIASGYWRISDTQTGYTAISLSALRSIKLYDIYARYGWPNDLLVKLNMSYCTIREIPIKPVYSIGERSKMKIHKVIPSISWLLFRSFFKRIWVKYFFKDFHPLFILYNLSFLLFLASIPFAVTILRYLSGAITGDKPILNSIMFMFLIVSATQSLLFAMWMDIQDNERLYK
jgi:glycosyltransferase involved in cell wall biosynthesis